LIASEPAAAYTEDSRDQVLPPLSADEYAALKADIAAHGVLLPIEVDETGAVLDGHARLQIVNELLAEGFQVKPPQIRVHFGLVDEAAKRTTVRRLNLLRRHLDAAGKRAVVRAQLLETPGETALAISRMLGVGDDLVAAVRREMEAAGEIPNPIQELGGNYSENESLPPLPAIPPKRKEYQAAARAAVEAAVAAAPAASDREIARRTGVSPPTVGKIRRDLRAQNAERTSAGTPRPHLVLLVGNGADAAAAARLHTEAPNLLQDVVEGKRTLAGAVKAHQTKALQSSESDDWYTPAKYIEAARVVLGVIDLDPASCDLANRTVRASKYYSIDDDGLSRPWGGRVWMAPPYGSLTGPFVKHLLTEYAAGRVSAAVLLVNAHATDSSWFQPLWDYPLCFTDHRINFQPPPGRPQAGSTHGSVFAYLGPCQTKFAETFRQFGAVVRRWP
jgi:ParB-like chromosome segregation protein Spo0J